MATDRDLFGQPVDKGEPRRCFPEWFTKGTAAQERRVLAGLHPMGSELSKVPGARCGNCSHLEARTWTGARYYLKCALVKRTRGPGTDIRAKWRACSSWVVAPPDRHVRSRRP